MNINNDKWICDIIYIKRDTGQYASARLCLIYSQASSKSNDNNEKEYIIEWIVYNILEKELRKEYADIWTKKYLLLANIW